MLMIMRTTLVASLLVGLPLSALTAQESRPTAQEAVQVDTVVIHVDGMS